jgi:ribosomal protein S18 acetylase RimI-like enzyme
MQIEITQINQDNQFDFGTCDASFTMASRLVLNISGGKIGYTICEVVPPYTKNYGHRRMDFVEYADADDRTIFLAYVDHQIAGEVRITEAWNKYALIDDLVVDPKYRRQGIGRQLIQRCIAWAKEKGFPGVTLETQDINAPACTLYERCGFELCGFDTHLYRALHPGIDEIALYWYLIF